MKKTIVTVLVIVLIVLVLGIAGTLGFLWYRDHHVFVEGDAYEITAKSLDLTEKDISVAYYEELQAKLPGCEIKWMVPFQNGKFASDTESLTVSSLTLEEVEFLANYFPNLKKLDASECSAYDVLSVAEATLTNCELTYYVDLGHPGHQPPYNAEFVQLNFGEILAGETYDFDTLIQNLTYLPDLKQLKLEKVVYSLEQVESLREAYPNVEILCTVEILGKEYDMETTELDLSALTDADVTAAAQQLSLLPNLNHVNLNPDGGMGTLSLESVKTLMEAVPGVVFDYTFDFYGHTLSTADEEVHIKNTKIGDEGEQNIRNALDLLTNCKRFVLEYCQVSYDLLAKIRDDYRDRTKVVWRVEFAEGSTLTDAEVIRSTWGLRDSNCKNLIYCEGARFLDFGHNGDEKGCYWKDCSFVAGMPNLEAAIFSGSYVADISAFANCKNLKFLELAFCGNVTDISVLANCEKLEMLNISFTSVTDISALDNLPMKLLCAKNYSNKRVSQVDQDRFQQLHPDCWAQYVGEQPYGSGWRYDKDEITPLPYYALLRAVFRYDLGDRLPNHAGWNLTEEAQTLLAAMEPAQAAVEETVPAETVPEETVPETTAVEE